MRPALLPALGKVWHSLVWLSSPREAAPTLIQLQNYPRGFSKVSLGHTHIQKLGIYKGEVLDLF